MAPQHLWVCDTRRRRAGAERPPWGRVAGGRRVLDVGSEKQPLRLPVMRVARGSARGAGAFRTGQDRRREDRTVSGQGRCEGAQSCGVVATGRGVGSRTVSGKFTGACAVEENGPVLKWKS